MLTTTADAAGSANVDTAELDTVELDTVELDTARLDPATDAPPGDATPGPAAGWRLLVGLPTLEIDGAGRIASIHRAGDGPFAPLARCEGRSMADALRASDRVAWLHALDGARHGHARALRLSLCPSGDGRSWIDATVRLAPGGTPDEPSVLVALEALPAPERPPAPPVTELAHELRTPLNAVRGYAQALDAGLFGALNPHQHDAVRGIADAAEHLIEIANATLDGARLGAGDALSLAEADPGEAIARGCAMLAGLAERAGVTIAHRPAPVLALRHDAAALRQIVVNLVSNAVKASPRGGVVGVDLRATGSGIEIAVRDAGHGIDPAVAEGTAAAWGRGIAAEGEATGGVGLPLVRRLCALHGGTLRFVPREGGGTVATVRLPGATHRATDPATDPATIAARPAATDAPVDAPAREASGPAALTPAVPAPDARSGDAPAPGSSVSASVGADPIRRFEAAFPCRLVG